LACADGLANTVVARRVRVAPGTVGTWRQRFLEDRLDGRLDEPRPGTPRGETRWSTRSMAKATGHGAMAISRVWRAFGLQPHRTETFTRSPDPLLIDKVRDIVGLYLAPPEHALGLCVDEKSQIQALDRTAPLLPLRPGQVERRTHDHHRHGTATLFAALDVKTGKVFGETRARQRAVECRKFLDLVDANVPADLDVHLTLDNCGAHKTPLIRRWCAKRPRYHLHFTRTPFSRASPGSPSAPWRPTRRTYDANHRDRTLGPNDANDATDPVASFDASPRAPGAAVRRGSQESPLAISSGHARNRSAVLPSPIPYRTLALM
jgi:transposase